MWRFLWDYPRAKMKYVQVWQTFLDTREQEYPRDFLSCPFNLQSVSSPEPSCPYLAEENFDS